MAQRADDAPTDLLDHVGDVGIGRGRAREKAGFVAFVGAIEKHPLQEKQVIVPIEIEGTAKTLDKRDRAGVDGGALAPALDRLVDVILPDGGANDRMDLGREVLGRRCPVAQGDGHRDDPLPCRHPGNDLLDEVRRRLSHAPAGTRGAKPPPLTTERHQQLVVTGVTAQAQKAMGKDATP